jgi:prepilin-type N-terminal cleavage/methylation domain-containing protein
MKTRRQTGFTLIELTLVMAISVMVAGALIGMLQAHIQMLTQAAKNTFLAQDAPFIGLLLTRTMGNADDYRIYADGPTAMSDGTRTTTGAAVRLWMRQPNSTTNTLQQAVISFETYNSHQGIYFYLTDPITGVLPATPSWEMAGGKLTNAKFEFDLTTAPHPGVLLVTLTGSYGDWYQFAAEKK